MPRKLRDVLSELRDDIAGTPSLKAPPKMHLEFLDRYKKPGQTHQDAELAAMTYPDWMTGDQVMVVEFIKPAPGGGSPATLPDPSTGIKCEYRPMPTAIDPATWRTHQPMEGKS